MTKQINSATDRRRFMKMLLSSGALGSLGQLGLLSPAAAAAPAFTDYKALVCVFLKGGNDSFNMLVPTGSDAYRGYAPYAAIRGNLAVSQQSLNTGNLYTGPLGAGSGNPYFSGGTEAGAYLQGVYDLAAQGIDLGVNGVMPELAQLIASQRASVAANIGTLVRPVNRDEILAKTADLPVFLFAHNHQQRILQTGQAHALGDIGWAGKIADYWQGINGGSTLGLNVSYAGNDRMLIGQRSSPLVVSPGNPPRFAEMVTGGHQADDDRIALFHALQAQQGNDPFERLYAGMLDRSFDTFDQLYKVWSSNEVTYQTTGSYGEPLFAKPSAADLGFSNDIKGGLIAQLQAVAKMIHLSASGAFGNVFQRQIFLVSLGGFDTHAEQQTKHPLLLRELSLGLWKFQQAMEELGHANQVNTFTMSDFGRTMSNNGDGTDHAWGAHHLVMGGDGQTGSGALPGGKMFGQLPDITLEGSDDHGRKGRIIPSTSQDQLNASLCRWLGVADSQLATIFPNLNHFSATDDSLYTG